MGVPKRIRKYEGRKSFVDGIPFTLPVACKNSPVLMAVFPVNYEKAKTFMQGNEVHPFRLWNKALLVITVIDYRETVIGKYIEYSIAIACTHGPKPAPRLLPALFMKHYGTGQYVVDLPVSSEVSVKGGKGIWGMPKHQGNLDFKITDEKISSQYDLDGQLVTYVEIDRPCGFKLPINVSASNYCAFRGMLMKSDIYFNAKAKFCFGSNAKGRFVIGDHPRLQRMKELDIPDKPMATAFIPSATGTLDDHFECWFLNYPEMPDRQIEEGFDSVIDLTNSEEWLAPPTAPIPPPK